MDNWMEESRLFGKKDLMMVNINPGRKELYHDKIMVLFFQNKIVFFYKKIPHSALLHSE